jgi:hypothetical protein
MSKQILAALAVASCALATAAHADTAITENTTVGGKGFIDLTSLDAKAKDVKTPGSGIGIDVTRFYLVANHTFDSTWAANLTTDFNYSGTTGETQLFVKKAYLQAKLSDAFWLRAGSADLPWIPFVEDVYGYRYLEKVIIDRTKFGTSADWGVHIGGKLADGTVSYALSAVEGNGYKNPTRSKSLDVEGRLSFVPVQGLTAAVGFYSGKLGKDVEGTATPVQHTATRYNALLAYSIDQFRIGAEYFSADNWTAVTSATKDSANGYAVWAGYNFTSDVAGFVRYDEEKPNKDTVSTLKDEYYNAGVSFKPRKGVDISIAYKHEDVKNSAAAVQPAKSDEVGVWAQVAF